MSDMSDEENSIAIIGMAGRFPGAENVEKFWDNLCLGIESISHFSDKALKDAGISEKLINNKNYVKARSILESIELFDADFFGFSAKEAQITDPQHRIFLECSWEALENAGYCPEKYSGSIGVYGGTGMSSYFLNNIYPNEELKESLGEYLIHIGNEKDFLTTRVSYKLNLKGPSLAVQTACSTSLAAICLACNHLLSYSCDMALAGGVSITVPQVNGYMYQEGMIFSPDGRCRPFDAQANGTVSGNGAGIVVLKRLHDAVRDRDHIYAVIKGYGINNDGMEKIGFSAPGVQGQTEAISSAIAMAGINPETITYAEAHGTGTFLGDPIEIKALTQAFRIYTQKNAFCSMGSLKGNVGHLIEAAGVAGLMKAAYALQHQKIPPSLHFNKVNPHIDFASSPFYINTSLQDWKTEKEPRRACVSSFGMGGTNAHVVLEEKPRQKSSNILRQNQLIVLSAKSSNALKNMRKNLAEALDKNPQLSLADVAYTLQVGRTVFKHKQFIISGSSEKTIEQLLESDVPPSIDIRSKPSIIFMMPGDVSQHINMGKELYLTEPVYRQAIEECSNIIKNQLGYDLLSLLFPNSEQHANAKDIENSALFATEYALAKLWQSWGVNPQAMIGQGIGEYVAACLAGVFSLNEGLLALSSSNDLKQIKFKSPKMPFISNLTGTWIKNEEAMSPEYWLKNLQATADLSLGIHELLKDPNRIFIEIGPGTTLCDTVKACMKSNSKIKMLPSMAGKNQQLQDSEILLSALGCLWMSGASINWEGFHKYEKPHRIPLPTYPFEKKRYWIDPIQKEASNVASPASRLDNLAPVSIENSLLDIWKELLGFESINIEDDFFKLGGDSLVAIQILSKMQTVFGIVLRPQTLLECPTIPQLSSVIRQKIAEKNKESEAETDSIIVKIRSGSEDKPLFFIHPIGGQVFCYKPLADCLKYNGPIYGIQAAAENKCLNTIEEIASFYIQAIRKIQPNGPYHFLGASFGGLVAYEMTRQLEEANERVNLLAMVDIICPDHDTRLISDDISMLALLIELFESKSISTCSLKELSPNDQIKKLMKSMGLETLTFSEQQKIFNQVKNHWKTLINYHPKPCSSKILFFEGQDRFLRHKDISLGSTWKELAKGGIDIHEMTGNHVSMIMHPHVTILAHLLDTYLIGKL